MGMALLMAITIAGCGNSEKETQQEPEKVEDTADGKIEEPAEEPVEGEAQTADENEETEIYVFIAKSLSGAMEEIADLYKETHTNVSISYNADSSGTLQTQIEEGFECDLYFSAATKQMTTLNEGGFIESDTIVNLLGNKLCLITYKDSGTTVTGFADMSNASNMALADGSVPVGKYTRQLLMNMGVIQTDEGTDPAEIATDQVKEALGGIEINECANVGAVAEAVKEGSNEIGTVYYSDAYAVKDYVEIIEEADPSLLGDPICYPVALVKNQEADDAQTAAAKEFYDFLLTNECKDIFLKYMFTEYSE